MTAQAHMQGQSAGCLLQLRGLGAAVSSSPQVELEARGAPMRSKCQDSRGLIACTVLGPSPCVRSHCVLLRPAHFAPQDGSPSGRAASAGSCWLPLAAAPSRRSSAACRVQQLQLRIRHARRQVARPER